MPELGRKKSEIEAFKYAYSGVMEKYINGAKDPDAVKSRQLDVAFFLDNLSKSKKSKALAAILTEIKNELC